VSGVALPDGLVAVVKRDCSTCEMVAPLLRELAAAKPLTVYSQDDPAFPADMRVVDDTNLAVSDALDVEVVPTFLRVAGGKIVGRTQGWRRDEWRALSGVAGLGAELPEFRPGCGSLTQDPDIAARLAARKSETQISSRRIQLGEREDPFDAMHARGWSDGLPLVPPTPERVARMLAGTSRAAADVVAIVPPDLAHCSVEKVAINAVMAGCQPEYLPVVLAAVEAACTDEFNAHGVLATTMAVGPAIVVNGPIAPAIGMNSGVNALGQGNRANATIGRALQLVIRNVGGGKPAGVDQATLGNPGKYTLCFAEDEAGSPWEPLAVERGIPAGTSAVTLIAVEGPRVVVDQKSRTADSLARSFAGCLRTVWHPKLAQTCDVLLVISPEHARVFRAADWSKRRLRDELVNLLTLSGDELVAGYGGCAEGMPPRYAGERVPKFSPDSLFLVHAGGSAGMFSAIMSGWARGPGGSQPVTRAIKP